MRKQGTYVCSVVVGGVKDVSCVACLGRDERRTSLLEDGGSSCEITTELHSKGIST